MTSILRNSTMTLFNRTQNSVKQTQSELNVLTRQISSGKNAETFLEVNEKVPSEVLLALRDQHSVSETRIKNNNLLDNKLSAMSNALLASKDVISNTISLVVRAKDPVIGQNLDSVELAKQQLGTIRNILNSQFNGQYLFAGNKISTEPVSDIVSTSNIVAGNVTYNYYNGDNSTQSLKISDTLVANYGITANENAFMELIAALHNMIDAKNLNDPTRYDTALDQLNSAKDKLGNLISTLGNNQMIVNTQVSLDTDKNLHLNELIQEIEDTDLTYALSKLAAVQNNLQAAYMLLVKANSVTLADFIK
jgi:flagellar hook-associated protein 3 FlgL